jgi:multidrug efflux pump subunit AcrA (membrane-fusion protein)
MVADLIQQFESQLEQLEAAARQGDSLTGLLQKARTALLLLTTSADIVLTISERRQTRLIAGTLPAEDCERCAGMEGTFADGQDESVVSRSASHSAAASTPTRADWTISLRRRLSSEHSLLVMFLLQEDPKPRQVIRDAILTLTDILADAAARRMLSELTQRLQDHERTQTFVRSLARAVTREQWAYETAQRGAEFLGKGRVSVLAKESGGWQVMAATGSVTLNRASEAIRGNEHAVALLIAGSMTSSWLDTAADKSRSSDDSALSALLAQFAVYGVQQVRVETISGNDGGVAYALLVEVFESSAVPTESLWALIRNEISESARLLPRTSSSQSWAIVRTPLRRFLLGTLVALLFLWLTPADFEIEVSGQAFPNERRRLFAPDDGIVEQLLVRADDSVFAGQELLRVRNPERELQLNRVLGEIEAVASRILAIRATRTSNASGNAANASSRPSDLSSEEQQMEQKLNALRQEQALLEQQTAAMNVTAPIDGVVYQRRLQEQLTARPVQRGQLLLEVVNSSGAWELELQIPDSVVGYVRAASGETMFSGTAKSEGAANGLPVQFTLGSAPGQIHTTWLTSLDLATHLNDGQLNCPATAPVDASLSTQLRPGQVVTARIHCGRRSLGFVWFRELIEFWQRKKFAWL